MKYVYLFKEGNKDMKELLGGKGANLAEMTSLGLPVPQGFTITTEACNQYYAKGKVLDEEVKKQIFEKVEQLEKITDKKFGDKENPLLLSIRSGAKVSMPGMMDTILNLGMNDVVAESYANKTENPRFVYDSYRRLIQMYADVVKGYPKSAFENILEALKKEKNVKADMDLSPFDMKVLVQKYKEIYKSIGQEDFPQDPKVQLIEAVTAVFRSWMNERAIVYRKMHDIDESAGTAVNIQEMVYGNLSENSGTGVAFTRNPATGENKLYGEYLINAQGEDVVAGIRTPNAISTLKDKMPAIYEEFEKIAKTLENHYHDMQDMEFTIENGKLFMLQTRNGKRTGKAALKIAVDLEKERLITKEEALLMVEPESLDQLLHPMFDETALKEGNIIAKGLAASPGAGCGKIYFSASALEAAAEKGEQAILVRKETSPEDIKGMVRAEGILTIHGGMTSHAAVVARGMGRCCICGCTNLIINETEKTLTTKDGKVYKEGDAISLDGTTGNVYDGLIRKVEAEVSEEFKTFMSWADGIRHLKVRANADTPRDAKQAKKFGAEGIGLCRTEHMFFNEERIFHFRKMITSINEEQRKEALSQILPYQREDFEGLFEAMEGLPVIIRFLDPPLHEFLPHTTKKIRALAKSLNMPYQTLKNRVEELKEFNPMMGHRGCRLAITYPEIAKMQTRAVIEAAINIKEKGIPVKPEIMIPLICDEKEFHYVKEIVTEEAEKIIKEKNTSLDYFIGTMIETPRATLFADIIAEEAEFFSFGTNDLTQLTYGFSRDDASKFLTTYYEKGIFEKDPFAQIDEFGIGKLILLASKKAKRVRPTIELGICGEHGGEANSIAFCNKIGLDYVSCSPYRVPIARLAAAQASIQANQSK